MSNVMNISKRNVSAQILIVKPNSLTAEDKKILREVGVICIETEDPTTVRLIQPEGPMLGSTELFHAALKAIHEHSGQATKSSFVATVVNLIGQHMSEPT